MAGILHSRNDKVEDMVRKLILVVAIGAAAVLAACGKSAAPGEEYVGQWTEGNNTNRPITIARAGDGFDVTQTGMDGQPQVLHGKYQDGEIKVAVKSSSMDLAYDKQQDVIKGSIGGFQVSTLKRLKQGS
ncbi:hypothetical protein [Paraburkholderia youngii]|uniref:hypothetical protein n=1 Tax=Paraburkholderia youngii TaxID=2782701 RepID=UPI003D1B7AE4